MRIGPFEILDTLGSGGGGVVYRAHHTELDRIVALKQIRLAPGPETERATQRISREAKAMAAIESDYVVRLYSFQILDGRPTLEMEFVDGGSVETQNAAGPLSAADTAGLLRQSLRGLCAVHAAGYLHRDIKPSNILRTRTGRYKLADFGISGQNGSANTLHAGSVQYAAPEYIANADDVDARSDLYSLGFVAYEAALGRTAFQDVFRQHTGVDPLVSGAQWLAWLMDPGKEAAPLHHASTVPIELSVFITRLIEKDRTRRFESAAAALEELDRLQLHTPDDPGDVAYTVTGGTGVRLNAAKARYAAIAAGAVGCVVLAAVLWYAASRASAAPGGSSVAATGTPRPADPLGSRAAGNATALPTHPLPAVARFAVMPPDASAFKLILRSAPRVTGPSSAAFRGPAPAHPALHRASRPPSEIAATSTTHGANPDGAPDARSPAAPDPSGVTRLGVWIDAPDDLRQPLESAILSQGLDLAASDQTARWRVTARGAITVRPAPFDGTSAQTADYAVDVSVRDVLRQVREARHISGHALEFGDAAARGAAARAIAGELAALFKNLPR